MVPTVHVCRIGYTPLKGTRHLDHPEVRLAALGPAGDREYCLVDPARGQVLRSVANPTLVNAVATVADGCLRVDLPNGSAHGMPPASGPADKVDYWGRMVEVETLDGPWSALFSQHLGREVRLARVRHTGAVVYAGSVSLVSTSSMEALSARAGRAVDGARFRSTLVVDTAGSDAHVEDGWVGSSVRVGAAVLRVTGTVPRCAVVDTDPVSGNRDVPVLATLAGYRRSVGEVVFGVVAEVLVPARVGIGDPCTPERN